MAQQQKMLSEEQRISEDRNIQLQQALQDSKSKNEEILAMQDQLITSEKMASLGQLVAGVAHEINTPLAVINGGLDNISADIDFLSNDFIDFFSSMSVDLQNLMRELANSISTRNHPSTLSSREARTLRRELVVKFKEAKIETSDMLIGSLINVNMHNQILEHADLLSNSDSQGFLTSISKIGWLKNNINNMLTAIQKMQKIIFSLKYYSHQQVTNEIVNINIIEAIDSIITIYFNEIKKGITLVKDFESDELYIDCFPDELDQVWANLITNAIHAMDYNGTLTISAKKVGTDLVVGVNDTGTGISKEIIDNIFNAFYTTKPKGEGSGLGLNICKKIIDKHNGSIDITSEPGDTTFSVIIPLKLSN